MNKHFPEEHGKVGETISGDRALITDEDIEKALKEKEYTKEDMFHAWCNGFMDRSDPLTAKSTFDKFIKKYYAKKTNK